MTAFMPIQISATLTVTYATELNPDAYPGCHTVEQVGVFERDLIESNGDYLISMMGSTDTSTDLVAVSAVEATSAPVHPVDLAVLVGAVRNLHAAEYNSDSDEVWGINPRCGECQQSWPCPTVNVLDNPLVKG